MAIRAVCLRIIAVRPMYELAKDQYFARLVNNPSAKRQLSRNPLRNLLQIIVLSRYFLYSIGRFRIYSASSYHYLGIIVL